MDEDGRALQRLNEVRLDGLLEERRHGASRTQIIGRDEAAVASCGHHDPAEALLQVLRIGGKAQAGHHLGCDCDVETSLASDAVGAASEPHGDVAQCAVVHVDHPAQLNPLRLNAQRIAPIKVVVEHRGEKVMCRADGVEVACEVKVDRLHRDDLRVPSAGRAAFDAKAWA